MKTIVIASTNSHKLAEIKQIFSHNAKTKDIKLVDISQIGYTDDIDETGSTFLENALIKANAIVDYINKNNIDCYAVLSDDSGLCVDALNGEPGVYSARYGGGHGNNDLNRAKLLQNLSSKSNRDAYFKTVLVLMQKDKSYITTSGETYGTILLKPQGSTSFCYDCLFMSKDLNKCFGKCTENEKNSVSHRGRALQKLLDLI